MSVSWLEQWSLKLGDLKRQDKLPEEFGDLLEALEIDDCEDHFDKHIWRKRDPR